MNEAPRPLIIASSRPWNSGMAERLSRGTGRSVDLIDDPADLTLERVAALHPRFIFFPHWSWRIGSELFERYECVIFHMTDLPFGRGGSPLQNLIARGISETMLSAVRCVEEMDAGPIYLKKPLSLHGSAEEIFIRASGKVEQMILEIVEQEPAPRPQEGEVTVFKRRTPEDGDLSEASDLDGVFDLIRMLDADGYPKAFLDIGRFRLEFRRAARRVGEVEADVRITERESGRSIW